MAAATETGKTAEAGTKPVWSDAFTKLIGSDFVNNKGAKITADELKGKTIGIYFSAHWCPPCRGFTPELVKTYNLLKEQKKDFEIIFASSDKDQSSFDGYFNSMPWIAVPFADRKRKELLSAHYKVEGIPTLVIIDGSNGATITRNGRASVGNDLKGEHFPWHPKPADELNGDTVQDFNEVAVLIGFADYASGADQAASKQIVDAVTAIGKEAQADAKKSGVELSVNFLYALNHPVVPQVKRFLQIAEGGVSILDIPNRCKYFLDKKPAEITEAVVREFYASYKAGTAKKIMLPLAPPQDDDY